MTMHRTSWLLALVCSVAGMGLLWITNVPLGIPGEWTWPRLPADAQSLGSLILGGIGAAAYVTMVWYGGRRLAAARLPLERCLWLGGLFLGGLGWLWLVQETAPPAGQLAKAPFVLFYPSSSGYFFKVRYESPAADKLLAEYEPLMAEGDVLHVGTHPPGLFLLFQGLIACQSTCPSVTGWWYGFAPESFREAMLIVRENSAVTNHPAEARDGEVLWLACSLALGCAAATVWPLYGLLRFHLPREEAWWGAAFWPTLPALAMFLPKSDAAYPFISASLVYTVASAWRQKSPVLAACAGGILWLGLMASLAFLPVLLFCGLTIAAHQFVANWLQGTSSPQSLAANGAQRTASQIVSWVLAFVAGWGIPTVLLGWWGHVNLLQIWLWNYRNHAGFYAEFPRTWWKWLLVNPVELVFAVGIPLGIFAILAVREIVRRERASSTIFLATAAGVFVWGLLWISGKNSGEAGRLWLLLTPGVVWLASQFWQTSRSPAELTVADRRLRASGLLLQLAVGLMTVHRVAGFHLAQPDQAG